MFWLVLGVTYVAHGLGHGLSHSHLSFLKLGAETTQADTQSKTRLCGPSQCLAWPETRLETRMRVSKQSRARSGTRPCDPISNTHTIWALTPDHLTPVFKIFKLF